MYCELRTSDHQDKSQNKWVGEKVVIKECGMVTGQYFDELFLFANSNSRVSWSIGLYHIVTLFSNETIWRILNIIWNISEQVVQKRPTVNIIIIIIISYHTNISYHMSFKQLKKDLFATRGFPTLLLKTRQLNLSVVPFGGLSH